MHREGRGLGFIEFTSPRDAEDAKYGMDRSILDGKEVSPTWLKLISLIWPDCCNVALATSQVWYIGQC